MSKKRNDKESIICLTSKLSPLPAKKTFEIIGVSLWPPSSPECRPLDYAIWGVLENKTNATFHPNIGSLKTAFEEEWNKCMKNLFWRYANRLEGIFIDTITKNKKKNGGHIE